MVPGTQVGGVMGDSELDTTSFAQAADELHSGLLTHGPPLCCH